MSSAPPPDPEKLKAALEQLEAERERRIAAKIESGTAVRGSVGRVIGIADNKRAAPARDEQGREIFYEVDTIITGVPRSGRDVPGSPKAQPPAADNDRPDYGSHLKTYGSKPIPPRPKPPAEAVKPPEPGPIQTQVRGPSDDGKDPGEVISGWFDIQTAQNGQQQIVVWERSGGAPIGRAPCAPGDDPKVIARRLLREKRSGASGFYGPISYRTH